MEESILKLVEEHDRYISSCIPLIASENITGENVRKVLSSDLGHRYAEGIPGRRYYEGCKYIDEIEAKGIEIFKRLFEVEHVNLQPVSGVIANLSLYYAFTQPGDSVLVQTVPEGSHISHAWFGSPGIRGLKLLRLPFSHKEMNVEVDEAIKIINRERPKLLVVGGTLILFPPPIREIAEEIDKEITKIAYDAAHTLGLIAGKVHPKPFEEGLDALSGSTHKTFPGPQGGIVMCRRKFAEVIDKKIFPALVSNHHLHHLAGKVLTAIEMLERGESYAKQIIKNSKCLAEALHEDGYDVLCEEKGFTETHQVVLDVKKEGGGRKVARNLEECNILVNKNLLPWDDISSAHDPSGIRIGTQEVTRLGMKEGEMKYIAELISRAIKKPSEKVKKEAEEFIKKWHAGATG